MLYITVFKSLYHNQILLKNIHTYVVRCLQNWCDTLRPLCPPSVIVVCESLKTFKTYPLLACIKHIITKRFCTFVMRIVNFLCSNMKIVGFIQIEMVE